MRHALCYSCAASNLVWKSCYLEWNSELNNQINRWKNHEKKSFWNRSSQRNVLGIWMDRIIKKEAFFEPLLFIVNCNNYRSLQGRTIASVFKLMSVWKILITKIINSELSCLVLFVVKLLNLCTIDFAHHKRFNSTRLHCLYHFIFFRLFLHSKWSLQRKRSRRNNNY